VRRNGSSLGIVTRWLRGKRHTRESLGFKTSDLKDQERGLSFDASAANASLWRTRHRTRWRRLSHSWAVAQQASQRTGPPGLCGRGLTSAAAAAHTTQVGSADGRAGVITSVSVWGTPELSVGCCDYVYGSATARICSSDFSVWRNGSQHALSRD
jgi:hypothetical protein